MAGLAGFLCFGVGLLGIIFSYHFLSSNLAQKASLALADQGDAIKYLVLQSYDSTMVNFLVASVFYIGILIFLSVFTAEKLGKSYEIQVKSQIIITEEDKRIAVSKERKSKSQLFGLSVELIKGVIIGFVANAIFTIIWY